MNLELSTENIISLITCIITALGAFFIKVLEKKNNSNINDNILEQQLNKIYEPFAKQIEILNNYSMNSDFYKFVEQNLKENFSLYPSKLKEICIEILDKPYLLCPKNNYLKKLETNILSNYNWIRKKLKYPYDAENIQSSYIEVGNFEGKRKTSYNLAVGLNYIFFSVSLVLIAILIRSSFQGNLLNIIFTIITAIFFSYLIVMLFHSIQYTLQDNFKNG